MIDKLVRNGSVGSVLLGMFLTSPGLAAPRLEIPTASGNQTVWGPCLDPQVQSQIRRAFERGTPSMPITGTGATMEVTRSIVDIKSQNEPFATSTLLGFGTQTLSDCISTIRAAFSLQIKELAEILHVRRPTIYAWLEGEAVPHKQNRSRLQVVFRLAIRWNRLSSVPLGDSLHSFDSSGNSLYGLLCARHIPEGTVLSYFGAAVHRRTEMADKDAPIPSIEALLKRHGLTPSDEAISDRRIDALTGRRKSVE